MTSIAADDAVPLGEIAELTEPWTDPFSDPPLTHPAGTRFTVEAWVPDDDGRVIYYVGSSSAGHHDMSPPAGAVAPVSGG
jgi:hypothetical protein